MSRRRVDPARRAAFDALRAVHAGGAYANLALGDVLAKRQLSPADAGFATELVNGTCRWRGSYDQVIEAAAGRNLASLQPAVVDILRLGTHQLLAMRVPDHAAVSSSVELGMQAIGHRVSAVLNAILRKVARRTAEQWWAELSRGRDQYEALALRTGHPRWIVQAYGEVLPAGELEDGLAANNQPPPTTLVARPGLAQLTEIVDATPARWSPFGAHYDGNPGDLPAVRASLVGVQDEGSQLVALACARAAQTDAPWLDMCAGPGGKAALLAGLASERGGWLLAAEKREHRAKLVGQAVRAYGRPVPVIVADGTRPAWSPESFALVVADVPCSGLGALRRRPEARWRKLPSELDELVGLQCTLLNEAITATRTGGVVGYVTCSPHQAETTGVVQAVLAQRTDVELLTAANYLGEIADAGQFVQLWPHRHGTDAMFLALLRRR